MARTKNVDALVERECCICGRTFLPAVQHVFKVTGRWCCTYPCYLKLQAQIEAEKAAERAARKSENNKRLRKREGEKHGN